MVNEPNRHSESASCSRCGYALSGLPEGIRCPECGTPSGIRPTVRFVDNLSDAPVSYLRRLRLGLLTQCFAMGLAAATMGYSVYYGATRAGTLLVINNIEHILAGAFFLSGVLWLVGAWVSTSARPTGERTSPDMLLDSQRLRRAAWMTQAFLPASIFLIWTSQVGPGGVVGTVLAFVALLAMVAAAFSLIPIALYLSSIADWAGDAVLGDRMRNAAWVIAVLGTIGAISFVGALFPTVLEGLFRLASIAAFGLNVIAVLMIAMSFLLLANTTHWAILNNGSTAARNVRLANKRNAHLDELAARSQGKSDVVIDSDSGTCSGCGLDLTGLGSSGRCPECFAVFAKLGKAWTAEDLNHGIPLTDVEHREIIERSTDGRATKIRHISRAITVGRAKHRSSLGLDAGRSMFAEGPADSAPPGREINETLDNLPEAQPPAGPPPGP